jgi:mannose-6-phosphate isomerase-like protein (cupin superfamily)
MAKPYSINVYDLDTVDNVCNQVLREVISLPKVSMAHVIMAPGNVSLLHEHHKMTEIYFILDGEGILYHGDRALKIEKGAYLVLPPNSPHKIVNSDKDLEHLVFALPPFDPNDVHILDDEPSYAEPEPFKYDKQPFTARDGAIVYELLSAEERKELDMGLAIGSLEPKRKAIDHLHNISEEVYYVISGNGKVKLDGKEYEVRKGSVIYMPTNCVHALENTISEELEVLCLSSPCYTDADFILK